MIFGASSAQATARKLLSGLKRARALIRDGGVADLAKVSEQNRSLADRLEALATESDEALEALVAQIRAAADANSNMIEARLSGARAAQKRLDEIGKARGSLATYTVKGARVELAPPARARDLRG